MLVMLFENMLVDNQINVTPVKPALSESWNLCNPVPTVSVSPTAVTFPDVMYCRCVLGVPNQVTEGGAKSPLGQTIFPKGSTVIVAARTWFVCVCVIMHCIVCRFHGDISSALGIAACC